MICIFKISKGFESHPKTFRLPVPMIEMLEKLAEENNISVNQLVVQCIEYALNNIDNSDNEENNNL
ncbi:MAG: Arc family DNA-binding protein [Oscillospiraceae bacterium]|nr:Arc family DNA-binding protein [Oscillospiraceae bacterium]